MAEKLRRQTYRIDPGERDDVGIFIVCVVDSAQPERHPIPVATEGFQRIVSRVVDAAAAAAARRRINLVIPDAGEMFLWKRENQFLSLKLN